MAAKKHSTLFFERFLAFNQARFANDPEFKPLFDGLTEDDITVGDITRIESDAKRSTTITSNGRHFQGINQTWTPAPAATTQALYTLANAGAPLASAAELANQTQVGAYLYTDGTDTKIGFVIGAGTAEGDEAVAIKAALTAALLYTIDDNLVTVDNTANTITLDGDSFNGTVAYAVGAFEVKTIPATDYGTLGDGTDGGATPV